MTASEDPRREFQPARIGFALTLLLAAMVLSMLWSDYQQRLQAARDHAMAHATGVGRALTMQLRNLDRALAGLAGDALQVHRRAPESLPTLLPTLAAELAGRHAELDGVELVDARGRPIGTGRGDPSIATWAATADAAAPTLVFGVPRQEPASPRVLPMARPLPPLPGDLDGGWVLARLRLSALVPLVEGLPLGESGVAAVYDLSGNLLFASRDHGAPDAQQLAMHCPPDATPQDGIRDAVSPADGVRRLCVYRQLDEYPLRVVVGIGWYEVLAPWFGFVALSLLGAALYSAAWMLVLRRSRRSAAHRTELLTQLGEAERQYRFLFEQNPLAGWIQDRASDAILGANNAAQQLYGYTREQFLALQPVALRADGQAQTVPAGRSGPWRHRRADGSELDVMLHASDLDFAGKAVRLVLADDVSERERLKAQAAFLARHDELTRLPNRTAFLEQLDALLADRSRDNGIAVAVFDFNQFQLINDNLGHSVGDAVLRHVGERLLALAGDAQPVARLGGDEFALCLPTDATGFAAALQALQQQLTAPVETMGTLSYLTANIGIARFPAHADRADLLVKRASTAMHEAKRRAGQTIREFDPSLEQHSSRRLELVGRLHLAIERREFELFFQPQCRIRDERPVGVEALLRWRDPERGLVSPAEFVDLCESSGLIVPIGRWVLREAARQYQRLAAAGWGDLTVAVNVSALQFATPRYVEEVAACVREHDLPPGAIELELTESLVMDNPQQTIDRMAALRELGMRLSIDDFGTGYSSMAYLRRLPVHKLKIDRAFVTRVESDLHNAAICSSMLALARSFGLASIAEGVETDAELAWLRGHGCDEVQGYLMARPMPFSELLVWLEKRASPPGTA